jgi:hypothetical protein
VLRYSSFPLSLHQQTGTGSCRDYSVRLWRAFTRGTSTGGSNTGPHRPGGWPSQERRRCPPPSRDGWSCTQAPIHSNPHVPSSAAMHAQTVPRPQPENREGGNGRREGGEFGAQADRGVGPRVLQELSAARASGVLAVGEEVDLRRVSERLPLELLGGEASELRATPP